jgi:hypothetical protein
MNEDQSGSALAGYLPQEVHVRPDLGLRVARHPDFFLDLIIVGPQVRIGDRPVVPSRPAGAP